MEIAVSVDRPSHQLTIAVRGELDIATAGQVVDAADAFGAARFDRVEVDVAGVEFCDCAGLSALLTVHHAICEHGGRMVVTHPRRQVRRLLDIAGCAWLVSGVPPAG